MADEYRYQIVDEERRFESSDAERFDRIGFALSVLDVLRPNMNITVYPGRARLQIKRGRDWSIGPTAFWAMIGIPQDASRQYIAYALAELVGVSGQRFVVDLLARVRRAPD